jgi:acyl carrier protein
MADDARARLARCFAAVFPDLPPGEIPRASTASVAAWDSLAAATLLAVVEEEFGVQVPAEDLDRFVSFEGILAYVEGRPGA